MDWFGFLGLRFTCLSAHLLFRGTMLVERKDVNLDFYGSPPRLDILGGRVSPPEGCLPIVRRHRDR